ncbi:hypothetical protein QR680_005989 [Steinernema hermaphroditum]|uniref:Uncharacterized protein n=1 Tax=Steinernema hermaphroditum TaxID=289476 RepID=A0AA39HTX2_9BILA|nr:hypothetical protein QR680_005989 [Steinernema hermaphroditum]
MSLTALTLSATRAPSRHSFPDSALRRLLDASAGFPHTYLRVGISLRAANIPRRSALPGYRPPSISSPETKKKSPAPFPSRRGLPEPFGALWCNLLRTRVILSSGRHSTHFGPIDDANCLEDRTRRQNAYRAGDREEVSCGRRRGSVGDDDDVRD